MTKVDIGIAQTSKTVGNSLQLIGRGTRISFGQQQQALLSNTNKGTKFGDLVFINEIHYDNAGTDVEKELK
jgi:hypothetical protein